MNRMRPHLPFIVIMPLLIVAMTWPTFPQIFDTDRQWIHQGGNNVNDRFWDAWHIGRVLEGKADYYFTDAIFHPPGVSLTWRQIALPHALAFAALQTIIPPENAYNLCYLLMLLFNATAVYVFLRYQFRDSLVSLFGAAVMGLAPIFAFSSTTPDLILVGTMPLAIYCLQRAIFEHRRRYAALAGIAIGATAFIGLYIYVCLSLTLIIYGARLTLPRWKCKSYWRLMLVLVFFAAALSSLRFYPMLVDRESMRAGLSKYSLLQSNSSDVVDWLVNKGNPWSEQVLKETFNLQPRSERGKGYLGYVPLALICFGLLRGHARRETLLWLAVLAVFLVLRAGDQLTFNGELYSEIALPKAYLNEMFPLLFDSVGLAARFQIGVVLPLAAASCYGLQALLSQRPPAYRYAAVCLCLALLLSEYYAPIQGAPRVEDRFAHIEWLQRDETETPKLVNLPLRPGVTRYYMYL